MQTWHLIMSFYHLDMLFCATNIQQQKNAPLKHHGLVSFAGSAQARTAMYSASVHSFPTSFALKLLSSSF